MLLDSEGVCVVEITELTREDDVPELMVDCVIVCPVDGDEEDGWTVLEDITMLLLLTIVVEGGEGVDAALGLLEYNELG
ncbi:hypothetical protein N7G274_001637 [Stereocaulon virgatum]|uniref:Uncharacterized protein n=1 Tax=Stereocaulon virgatum TaxID=373712 RepID=A0ABR4AKA0_9LECA